MNLQNCNENSFSTFTGHMTWCGIRGQKYCKRFFIKKNIRFETVETLQLYNKTELMERGFLKPWQILCVKTVKQRCLAEKSNLCESDDSVLMEIDLPKFRTLTTILLEKTEHKRRKHKTVMETQLNHVMATSYTH